MLQSILITIICAYFKNNFKTFYYGNRSTFMPHHATWKSFSMFISFVFKFFFALRLPPSFTFSSNPVLNFMGISEYLWTECWWKALFFSLTKVYNTQSVDMFFFFFTMARKLKMRRNGHTQKNWEIKKILKSCQTIQVYGQV